MAVKKLSRKEEAGLLKLQNLIENCPRLNADELMSRGAPLWAIKEICRRKKIKFEELGEFDEISEKSGVSKKFLLLDGQGNPIRINIETVVHYFLTKYFFLTFFGKKSENSFVFLNGRYSGRAKEIVFSESEKILSGWGKSHSIDEIFRKIKRKTLVSEEELRNRELPLHLIPVTNGLYDVDSGELKSHDHAYFYTFQHPIVFRKNAKCPRFLKFIKEILPEDDISALQEILGFSFYRQYLFKKCFIFAGGVDTGKTVLLKVFSNLIGEENLSGLPLQTIASGDRMRLYFLRNKTLNVYDDLSSRDLSDGGGLKIATGGGLITAEEKFSDVIQFYNFSKLLFACNRIPSIKDADDLAYYTRFMPFEFLNKIPPERQDVHLTEKLMVESSGIFLWAMAGLSRLLEKKQFSYTKSGSEVTRIMKAGNPLISFANSCLVEKAGEKITKEKMWRIYDLFARDRNITRFSKEQLGRNLSKACPFVQAKNDSHERYWEGAVFSELGNEFLRKLDTLDTSKKNIRKNLKEVKNSNQKLLYVFSKKASKVFNNFNPEEAFK